MAKKSVKTAQTSKKAKSAKPTKAVSDKTKALVKVKTEASKQEVLTKLTAVDAQAMTTAKQAAAQVKLLTITDAETAMQANAMLVQLKQAEKALQERRDIVVKPLKEHIKTLEALFKPTMDVLKSADLELRGKVIGWQSAQQRAADEARAELLKKASAAQEAGDTSGATELATQAIELAETKKSTVVDGGGVVQSKAVWQFEVEDMGIVPKEYFSLNEAAVRAAIRSGVREIPGLRIYQEQQLAVSA